MIPDEAPELPELPGGDVIENAPKRFRDTVWLMYFVAAIAVATGSLVIGSLSMMGHIAKSAAAEIVQPVEQHIDQHEKEDDSRWKEVADGLKQLQADMKDTHDQVTQINQWRRDQEADDAKEKRR